MDGETEGGQNSLDSGRRRLSPASRSGAMAKGMFGFQELKFNSHHIDVLSNAWSTKCRLIAYMSVQIRNNLRDESIKSN
jgi:hypothetical protein